MEPPASGECRCTHWSLQVFAVYIELLIVGRSEDIPGLLLPIFIGVRTIRVCIYIHIYIYTHIYTHTPQSDHAYMHAEQFRISRWTSSAFLLWGVGRCSAAWLFNYSVFNPISWFRVEDGVSSRGSNDVLKLLDFRWLLSTVLL